MASQKQTKIVHPGGFDGGVVRVPGDKSISHRTALLEDDRTSLDIEIEVLRERLQQDGLTPVRQ